MPRRRRRQSPVRPADFAKIPASPRRKGRASRRSSAREAPAAGAPPERSEARLHRRLQREGPANPPPTRACAQPAARQQMRAARPRRGPSTIARQSAHLSPLLPSLKALPSDARGGKMLQPEGMKAPDRLGDARRAADPGGAAYIARELAGKGFL